MKLVEAKALQHGQRVRVVGGKNAVGALMFPYYGVVHRFLNSYGESRKKMFVISDNGGGYWVSFCCLCSI